MTPGYTKNVFDNDTPTPRQIIDKYKKGKFKSTDSEFITKNK